jgi:hypothetical protein
MKTFNWLLKSLERALRSLIHTYDRGKLLVIDVDNINFVDNPDLGEAAQRKRTKTPTTFLSR